MGLRTSIWSTAIAVIIIPTAAQRLASQHGRRATESLVLSPVDTAAHLYHGLYSGMKDSARLVLHDSIGFAAVWRTVRGLNLGVPEQPNIEMRTHDVIVAALGAQGAIGPRISIDSIVMRGHERIVIVRRTYPPRDCMESQVFNSPIDVVVVPADRSRATRFIERRRDLRRCS